MGKRSLGSGERGAWAAGALLILLAACGGEAAEEADSPSLPTQGVAVVVRTVDGHLAPGLFDGPQDEAAERSEGTFLLREDEPGVFIVPVGRWWAPIELDVDGRGGGLVVLAHSSDGEVGPGMFMGPPRLAEELGRSIATRLGIDRTSGPAVLDADVEHSRTRRFEPGTVVRLVD